jgi:hypothetical protein
VAHTASEARAIAKQYLGLRRRLPIGAKARKMPAKR